MEKEHKLEAIDHLNALLTRHYDAEKGFEQAADNVEHPLLKDFFKGSARQRYQFGHEIKEEITKMDGKPDKGSSLAGDAHRTWMNLKDKVTSKDNKAMLEECDRGEKIALETYEKVLDTTEIPPSALKVVQQQRETITQNIKHIENLLHNIK